MVWATGFSTNIKSKSKCISSIFLKIGIEYYTKQDRINSADNTETPTLGYVLFNAGVGADITNRQGKVLVSINILENNITNVAYQSHMSRLKYF